MATLTAGELTNLRTKWHYVVPKLSVLKPDTLLSARVNDAGIARGDRSIAYDTGSGTFASIEAGQTLWVGTSAGDNDVGKIRIKSISGNASSGTITVDENGIDWGNNLHLTIKHNYEIWAIPPRIDSSGAFYKFYNVTYSDQNEDVNPVAIAGPHRAGELESGSIVFNIDASNSYAVANGATISSYQWSCTGGTIASDTSATTTITFTTAGTYWLKLTVTDGNGKAQSTYRVIFVHDADNPPYRDFGIQSMSGSWSQNGWSFSIAASGDVTLDDFPDGSLVVLWYDSYMNGVETYVNVWDEANEVLCNGYIRRDDDSDSLDEGDGAVTFTVDTPNAVLANRNEMGTVSIKANASPSTWYEYASWLTIGRAVHHLLKWHSTVLETVDVYGLLDNTLGVERVQMTEDSLLQRINSLAFNRGIFAKMVSDRLGRLHLVEDIQYFNQSNRNAEDTVFSLDEDDISGTVSLSRESDKQQALGFIDGFEFDGSTGTPYIAIIPGYIDASATSIQLPEISGTGSRNKGRQVVNNQTDANEKVGRDFAIANNPYKSLDTPLRGNYIGAFDIIPSLGWYGWGLDDSTLKRNLSLNGTKALCRQVNVSFPLAGDIYSGDIQVSVGLEQEAFGPDGIPGNYPTSYPTITPPSPNWTLPTPVVTCGTLALGARDTAGATDRMVGSAALSSTKVIGVYQDDITSEAYGIVWTVSGNTITAGSPTALSGGDAVLAIDVAALSDTSAILTYTNQSNNDVEAVILSISGTTITVNSSVTVDALTTGPKGMQVVALTSTKAIIVYPNPDDSDNGYACVLDVSGTTITVRTPAVFTTDDVEDAIAADKISDSAILVSYMDVFSPNYLSGVIVYNITTTFSSGSSVLLDTTGAAFNSDFAKDFARVLTDTLAVIAFSPQDSGTFKIAAVPVTINGSTGVLSAGTTSILNSPVSSELFISVNKMNDTQAVIGYYSNDDATGYIVSVDVTSSTITDNNDEVALPDVETASGARNDAACAIRLEANKAAIIYAIDDGGLAVAGNVIYCS